MSHRNARLNVRGRQLLVERVCEQGWAVAHAAKAQGVSRQCAPRWIRRFREAGRRGVETRSSSPVRILRGENYQSVITGLYPCGEGAGYAGGITSAAVDGIRVAEAVAQG